MAAVSMASIFSQRAVLRARFSSSFFLQVLEELLVALVDRGGSRLEACPDFFAELLGHGARFLELLVQGLQLLEGGNHVGFFAQFLCRLAQAGLDLQVLLEVVLAEFIVQFQLVVVLFYV